METRLKIVVIASECVPFAKTGGLADVVGALPQSLAKLGHDVMVVVPKYALVDVDRYHIQPFLSPMGVWMGNIEEWCAVHMTTDDYVPIYFIESDKYFGRDGLYHDSEFNDFLDNPRRFAFFTRAALQLCRDLAFRPDIVHVHDWQTALGPAYLKVWHGDDEILGGAASVLTIHNIGYQGKYSADDYEYVGLGWGNFTPDKLEDYGGINFLKGGIQYADLVTTVSPTYARETRTPEGGWGLAPYLNDKGDRYLGILNGVGYEQWNPATDPLIPANYSPDDMAGKAICKRELQERFLLEENPAVPLVGLVSRLVQQKGLDLLADVIEDVVREMVVQFALLGTGDKGLEAFFGKLPARYPGRIGVHIGYSDELAHWIEAGSDFSVMPSLYEPCGLNQIYSLRYGTLPVVRATGGLDDTVEQYDEVTGAGTGFKFWDPTPRALYDTLGWAVSTYYDRKHHLATLIQRAMSKRFSWDDSAREYVRAYAKAMEIKRSL
jgi:starch synthase